MSTVTLLPPSPDVCQTCAVDHSAGQPHNPQSLFWATKRKMEGKTPPSWELALAHCDEQTQNKWILALGEKGVFVDRALMARLLVDEAATEQAEALDASQADRRAAEDAQAKAEGLQTPTRIGED